MTIDDYTVAWRVWYDNGTTEPTVYTSETSTLEQLPDDGFLAMRLWYADGTGRYISGNDFYFFVQHEAGIIFGQSNETSEQIEARYPGALIKRGKYVSEGLIKRITDEMSASENPCSTCP